MNSHRRINILQLVNGFAIGGGELKLLELVKNVSTEKYNTFVCSVGQGGPLQEEFKKVCPNVYVLNKKHRFDISLVFKVAKLMKKEKIDIVQTTLFYADVIGAIAAKMAKVSVVISWEVVTQSFKAIHRMAYKVAQRNIDMVITVSDAINKKMVEVRKIGSRKVKTIHYGVDLTKFHLNGQEKSLRRKELGFSDNDILVGTVARLTEQKGHKYLLPAAQGIVKRFRNVKFVFIGDGPLRSDIESQICSLNIKSNCKLLGFRTDVKEILNLFDVFVLPSLYEGLPNVVLEAMACGNPVVATAVDGTVEAVEHGVTGLLVSPKNPEALEEALISLITDKDKMILMGKNGRKRVEKFFSLDKQIEKFEELYDNFAMDRIMN